MHIALAALAASTVNMTPTSLVGLAVAFIGLVVLCFNGLRQRTTGKLSGMLLALGISLVVSGMVLASTALQSSP